MDGVSQNSAAGTGRGPSISPTDRKHVRGTRNVTFVLPPTEPDASTSGVTASGRTVTCSPVVPSHRKAVFQRFTKDFEVAKKIFCVGALVGGALMLAGMLAHSDATGLTGAVVGTLAIGAPIYRIGWQLAADRSSRRANAADMKALQQRDDFKPQAALQLHVNKANGVRGEVAVLTAEGLQEVLDGIRSLANDFHSSELRGRAVASAMAQLLNGAVSLRCTTSRKVLISAVVQLYSDRRCAKRHAEAALDQIEDHLRTHRPRTWRNNSAEGWRQVIADGHATLEVIHEARHAHDIDVMEAPLEPDPPAPEATPAPATPAPATEALEVESEPA